MNIRDVFNDLQSRRLNELKIKFLNNIKDPDQKNQISHSFEKLIKDINRIAGQNAELFQEIEAAEVPVKPQAKKPVEKAAEPVAKKAAPVAEEDWVFINEPAVEKPAAKPAQPAAAKGAPAFSKEVGEKEFQAKRGDKKKTSSFGISFVELRALNNQ